MKTLLSHKLILAVLPILMFGACSKLDKVTGPEAPDIPSSPSPGDGEAIPPDTLDIELSWTCADPDGDLLTYDIYFDTSAVPAIYDSLIDTTVYVIRGLFYNRTYYWQVVARDSTGLETEGPIWNFSISWPSGGMIAFASNRDSSNYDIFTMWADGTHQRNITNSPGDDTAPSWSPDASKIAFASTREGHGEIYVMNSDGSDAVNISNDPAFDDNFPAWSPNGDKIAFSSYRTGNWEIYIMNPDGSQQYNLTINGASDYYCSWNPTGDRMAFHSNRASNWDIYLMDDDGGSQTRITTSGAVDAYPSWSPNGLLIVFRSSIPGNNDIYLMNIDGSNQFNISNHSGDDEWPQWSPDGTRIVFYSNRTGNYQIFTMNIDGTNLINVSNSPTSNNISPSWSPVH
jgi:Tol biopolymer transport system component